MNTPPILDARRCLDIDLTGVRMIEASAGTGKTYTIANFYLRHILEGRAPAQILVVSFTNAATDELQQRIRARLQDAATVLDSGQPPADEFLALLLEQHALLDPQLQGRRRDGLQQALRGMDEAMITTIHGFCHAALQDHALLCNRQFEFALAGEDDEYWEQAIKDWWRSTAYPLGRSALALFDRALGSLDRLIESQREFRRHPDDRLIPEIETSLASLLEDNCDADPQGDSCETLLRTIRARAWCEALNYARPRVAAAKQAHAVLAYQDQLDQLLAALNNDRGERLAGQLRGRFPVAMIDEFQDTDRIQFEIFGKLYLDSAESSLTLIGDPKQAIYGFRGGDIFTYIDAKQRGNLEIHALDTNWRSQDRLVEAVNYLFSRRREPFIYDRAISFTPVRAASRGHATALFIDGKPSAALTLWQLPLASSGKTLGVGDMRRRISQALAHEISSLLDPASGAQLDARRLQSGDIAILVRTHDEGEEVRASLTEAGIGSVSIGQEGVFTSDEASGLYDLLAAVAEPGSEILMRRALACSLFAHDCAKLAAALDEDSAWQDWAEKLLALHRTWSQVGFIAMFQQMLELLDLGHALARQPLAERRLTNLLQLGELLQRQSRAMPGIESLLGWLGKQMSGKTSEESELRLESDVDLVRIVTIHKSKGLEYPVVFIPFAWRCKPRTTKSLPLRFHDKNHRPVSDLGSPDLEHHLPSAEKERLAEDLRLLYVAMTRARSKLYLAWGDVGDGRSGGRPRQTALGYLLHATQEAADLDHALPAAFTDAAKMLEELRCVADGCDAIERLALPEDIPRRIAPVGASAGRRPGLEPRIFRRQPGLAWRIGSFTSLTRDVHQSALAGEPGPSGDAVLDFPAGSHVGLLLHELLEELDFGAETDERNDILIRRKAAAYGLDGDAHRKTLALWLHFILQTEIAPGLRLAGLNNQRRINEMKFDFALDQCRIDELNDLLQRRSERVLPAIEQADFRGLITGVIDLVFEYRGKYYLADYKSNFLGARLTDYDAQALSRAMFERRYDLQALLYCVALHRYLGQRLRDYRYERHFGGCFYLFLRAMRPHNEPGYGVFHDCPSPETIGRLERLLAWTPISEGRS